MLQEAFKFSERVQTSRTRLNCLPVKSYKFHCITVVSRTSNPPENILFRMKIPLLTFVKGVL